MPKPRKKYAGRHNKGAGPPRKIKTKIRMVSSPKPSSVRAIGLAAEIERVKVAASDAELDYREAKATGDRDLIMATKKDWLDLVESLRKIELANPEVEKANAKVVSIATLIDNSCELASMFSVQAKALGNSLPQKCAYQSEVDIREIVNSEVDSMLRTIKEWLANQEEMDKEFSSKPIQTNSSQVKTKYAKPKQSNTTHSNANQTKTRQASN